MVPTRALAALLAVLALGPFVAAPPLAVAQLAGREVGPLQLGPAPRADPDLLPATSAGPVSRGIGLVVDTSNRQQVVDFFNTVYIPALAPQANWNGSAASCNPGSVSPAYAAAELQMLNYFRANGAPRRHRREPGRKRQVEPGRADDEGEQWPQSLAAPELVVLHGGRRRGRGSRQSRVGAAGASAIALYIADPGGGNYPAGHRRWVLYPPLSRRSGAATTT